MNEHYNIYSPKISIKNLPMRSIEELKNEISELQNVATGISAEIAVMNAKNQNAQRRRDMVNSKIDGIKWVLDEDGEQRHAIDE